MTESDNVTRRDCLRTAALAGAAIAVPTIVPASALGRGGAVAPSERITMAGVGIGPRGPVRHQSIFCEQGRARETTLSPASSRLLDMILRRLVCRHLVGLDHRTIL